MNDTLTEASSNDHFEPVQLMSQIPLQNMYIVQQASRNQLEFHIPFVIYRFDKMKVKFTLSIFAFFALSIVSVFSEIHLNLLQSVRSFEFCFHVTCQTQYEKYGEKMPEEKVPKLFLPRIDDFSTEFLAGFAHDSFERNRNELLCTRISCKCFNFFPAITNLPAQKKRNLKEEIELNVSKLSCLALRMSGYFGNEPLQARYQHSISCALGLTTLASFARFLFRLGSYFGWLETNITLFFDVTACLTRDFLDLWFFFLSSTSFAAFFFSFLLLCRRLWIFLPMVYLMHDSTV